MRTAYEFAAAIRTDGVHLLGTARAKCALVTTDIGLILCDKWAAAFFTHRFHFQGHFFPFRLEPFRWTVPTLCKSLATSIIRMDYNSNSHFIFDA
jgi:hypothetical protein